MADRITVDAPATDGTVVGGLLDLANIVSDSDALKVFHGVKYQSVLAGHSRRYVLGTDKVFDQLPIVEGAPFTVYRGIETSLFQRGIAPAEVARAFDASASHGVEQAVQALLNTSAVDITPTPGTPVTNVRAAVGLLEQYVAERYSGLPLLHGNKLATALIPEITIVGDKRFTQNGTPIVSGGGYGTAGPGGLVADPGEAWLYITGQVNIWRGDVDVHEAPALKENRFLSLAEATYVPAIDGIIAAILVGI